MQAKAAKFPCTLPRPTHPQYDEPMNLGFSEMFFLGILALLIFGPKKLPEIGRQVGRALSEFKRASDEFKSQIQSEINKIDVDPEIPRIDIKERVQNIFNPSPPVGSVASGSLPPAQLPAETASTIESTSQGHDA